MIPRYQRHRPTPPTTHERLLTLGTVARAQVVVFVAERRARAWIWLAGRVGFTGAAVHAVKIEEWRRVADIAEREIERVRVAAELRTLQRGEG